MKQASLDTLPRTSPSCWGYAALLPEDETDWAESGDEARALEQRIITTYFDWLLSLAAATQGEAGVSPRQGTHVRVRPGIQEVVIHGTLLASDPKWVGLTKWLAARRGLPEGPTADNAPRVQFESLDNKFRHFLGKLYFESNRVAFERMRARLRREYPNEYVAVLRGAAVAHGEEARQVAERVYARFGYVPVYVAHVSQPPATLRVVSPRLCS